MFTLFIGVLMFVLGGGVGGLVVLQWELRNLNKLKQDIDRNSAFIQESRDRIEESIQLQEQRHQVRLAHITAEIERVYQVSLASGIIDDSVELSTMHIQEWIKNTVDKAPYEETSLDLPVTVQDDLCIWFEEQLQKRSPYVECTAGTDGETIWYFTVPEKFRAWFPNMLNAVVVFDAERGLISHGPFYGVIQMSFDQVPCLEPHCTLESTVWCNGCNEYMCEPHYNLHQAMCEAK